MTITKEKLEQNTINMEIDGRQIEAAKGQTILDVARENGIDIPTLCHDPRLKPFGSCRVCLVEVEGARGPLVACAAEIADGMKVSTSTEAIKELRKLSLELLISNHWADCLAPCVKACPAGTDAQGYIGLISQGRYHEAAKLIKETNPFPSIIGRVCTRPCEKACRRNLVDERVGICWLKRFVGDYDLFSENRYRPEIAPATGKNIAVIGGGPAGLTCAYYSAINGHKVKVFEALPKPGGMLRYGIPAYRLPKDLLDMEISTVTDLGVEIETNKKIGKDFTLESLQKEYDAVFLGIGAQKSAKLRVEGEEIEGVFGGVDFLRRIGLGEKPKVGRRVAVVGGGNSGIDSARSCVRLGAEEVILIYRRSRNEMPAHNIEIEEAEREGVKLQLLTNPTRIIEENGKIVAIECVKMGLGEPDESGRRRPEPIKGSEFQIDVDMVIPSIGQTIDAEKTGVETTPKSTISINEETMETNIKGVFSGGDAVTGPKTAIQTIAAGRRAAIAIDQYFSGQEISLPPKPFSAEKVGISESDFEDEPRLEKVKMPGLKPSERRDFSEVEQGFSEEQAQAEAARCLECGCVKQNNCDLRDLCTEYDVDPSRFEGGEMNHYVIDQRHPFVQQDMNKCILCARCVRICDEVVGARAWTLVNRGFEVKVETAFGKPLQETTCESCGQCISSCPTAALVQNKPKFNREFLWPPKKVKTICPYCGVGCNLELVIDEKGQVIGIDNTVGEGPNNGNLCVKGKFAYNFINHKDRLKKPLIKKDGKFAEAGWDEAIDFISSRLKDIKEKHGPDSIGVLSSARCTNEENYVIQKFARAAIGTNNVDHCARLCHASSVAGLAQSFGSGAMTNPISDVEKSDCILVIGSNTTETHPVIGFKIRQMALQQKAKLIVIDPRNIKLAQVANHHLAQKPGSDVAVLNGLMKIILDEGLADEDFIEARTENFEEFKANLNDFTPEKVEAISGINAADLRETALAYGKAKNASIFYSMGITQHTCGTDNVLAIANLAMLTGNIGRPGTGVNPLRGQNNVQGACDMGALPTSLPGYQAVTSEAAEKFESKWGSPVPAESGLTVTEMTDAAHEGTLKALYIVGENPMMSDPDIDHVKEAYQKLDLIIVQDIFLNETGMLADVILPGASFAEKDGTFTNTERRVQLLTKAIEPVGESKPDWQITALLSKALGYDMNYNSTEEIMAEIAELTPQYGGISHERLKEKSLTWPCPDESSKGTPILHTKAFTRGKGNFQKIEYRPPAEQTDEDYPLILTTGRLLPQYHTGTMSRRTEGIEKLAPRAFVEINPKDADNLGIKEGQQVKVKSRRGQIEVEAKISDIREGTVFIPFHYAEAAANKLTNKAIDPVAKIPEFKVCAVKITKS